MNSPRTVIPQFPSMKQIDKINLDDSYNIYKDRFADASDFTFFFTGNFKIDEIKPMLETYLGGLPSINRKETWKDVEPKFPAGITEVTVHKGVEPMSMVSIMMKEKFDWNYKNIITNRIMMEILQISLRERTRDEKSEVYAVQVNGQEELYPEPFYEASFFWGCAPANVDDLIGLTFKEIKNMQKKGPSKTDLDKVKENLNRDRETDVKKNDFWLTKLENLYYEDVKLNTLDEFKKIVNSITAEDVQKVAQKYLPDEHYVKVVLMPETKKQ
jgi:zinc protease